MKLPSPIRVFERGWLSSNNVLLRGPSDVGGGATLIDSGYCSHATQTLALTRYALDVRPLDWLVNTHCHSDHMGGNAALRREFRCRTSIPAGEAPLIEDWDEQARMLAYFDQRAERFAFDTTIADGDVLKMGDIGWQVIAAPGHDPHAVVFYSPETRVLVSGDALWENGFGVIFPRLHGSDTAYAETRATLERIAALDARTVIPGHGRVFDGVNAALDRAFQRLESYERDDRRLARHAIKALFMFALLERRRMLLSDLPAYLQDIGALREINARHLQLSPQALADSMLMELERAGALKKDGDAIVPLIGA